MFTLVVMAAGIGRRFGGDKQLVEVGPDGESFLDYAISSAVTAGASKVVLVVRSEIESALRSHVDWRHDTCSAPASRSPASARTSTVHPRAKPWGTAQAVLVAESEVPGPFVVCNADDYYGPAAMSALASAAVDLNDGEPASAATASGAPCRRRALSAGAFANCPATASTASSSTTA